MELTEKKEFDLLSLGEIMLRLSPPDNERITRGDSFSKQAGGAELNAITGAAMLGLRCGIISKLPANDLGVYIKNRVRLCGVSDDYLVYDDDKDARLGVYYYENGAYPRKPRIVYDRKKHTAKINWKGTLWTGTRSMRVPMRSVEETQKPYWTPTIVDTYSNSYRGQGK